MERNTSQVVKDAFSLIGTSRYLAPEIIRNLKNVPSTAQDIWAFGCTVYQMISGKIPFDHLENEWAVMYHVGLGHIPGTLDQGLLSPTGIHFVDSCFTIDPCQRPTAFDLLNDKWLESRRM